MSLQKDQTPNSPELTEVERHLRDARIVKMEPILAGTAYWGRAEAESANAVMAERDPKRRQKLNRRVEQLANELQDLSRSEREEILLREIERWKKEATGTGGPREGAAREKNIAFPHPFTVFLCPVLHILADGAEHGVEEIRRQAAAEIGLTPENLALRHDSINQSVFVNKVAHALNRLVTHHAIAGEPKHQQVYRVTPHGLDVFRAHPIRVRVQDL
jgi:hypothetical protein